MNSTLTRTVRNGGEAALPEHRMKILEAANATHQALLAERDDLERKLREANAEIVEKKVQIEAMQGIHNLMESSITSHRIQRDEAVAKAASVLEALKNIGLIVDSYKPSQQEPPNDGSYD